MKASSEIDLLVRVGVLEKLVDRLTDKLDKIVVAVSQPVQPPVEQDEWEINNLNGTVEKKPEAIKDDLDNILDT